MYLPINRRYRPQRFDQVAGQNVVAQSLQNSIRSSRVGSAYLLSGLHGSGKTTIARVFATALVCELQQAEPCLECSSCRQVVSMSSPDLLELDAASHRGVDDISVISNFVRQAPIGTRKIVILDEVQMLTKQAESSLLKIIEEPPPHVHFLLCTTQPDAMSLPLRSRCVRYAMREISIKDIATNLHSICVAEGVEVEWSACVSLARQSRGSCRDAQTSLEQVIAFEGRVSEHAVARSLGLATEMSLIYLVDSLAKERLPEAWKTLRTILDDGADPNTVLLQLLDLLRDVLLLSIAVNDCPLVFVSDPGAVQQLTCIDRDCLLSCASSLDNSITNMAGSGSDRIRCEISVLSLMKCLT